MNVGPACKRVFSDAFTPTPENLDVSSEPPVQGLGTPPPFLPGSESFALCLDSNKENELPFYPHEGAEKKFQGGLEAGLQVQREFSPFSGAQGEVFHMDDPFRSALGALLPPVGSGAAPAPGFPGLDYLGHSLPAQNNDEFMYSSSPGGMCFDSEPSSDEVAESHAVSGYGYHGAPPTNNENTLMPDFHAHHGPLTPSALHFQDLNLQDDAPIQLNSMLSKFPAVAYNRSLVYTIPWYIFMNYFESLTPNQVVVVFDKGHQAIALDKEQLCNASIHFGKMLHRYCAVRSRRVDKQTLNNPRVPELTDLKPAANLCIRLRDDFPFAVLAMLQFIGRGAYVFEPNIVAEHPHITALDLHLHAYTMGLKYDVPLLRGLAVTEYSALAGSVLAMPLYPPPIYVRPDDPQWAAGAATPLPAPFGPLAEEPITIDQLAQQYLNNFLDSLVLLWKHTPDRHDAMRAAVLELIKPKLTALMREAFFVSLMSGIIDFGSDIVESLEEDGFDVRIEFPQGPTRGPIVFDTVDRMPF